MGRIRSHSLPWPPTQHSSPSPCLPSSIFNASPAFPREKLPANTSTLLPERGKGSEELGEISQVEMQRCRGETGQDRLCFCTTRIRLLPRELLKVLHWGINNLKQRNPSGFVLAARGAEQEPRHWVPPSLSLLGSSFEHLQHQSTGPDLLDKPDFIIF